MAMMYIALGQILFMDYLIFYFIWIYSLLTILRPFIYSESCETEDHFTGNSTTIFRAQQKFALKKLIQFCI